MFFQVDDIKKYIDIDEQKGVHINKSKLYTQESITHPFVYGIELMTLHSVLLRNDAIQIKRSPAYIKEITEEILYLFFLSYLHATNNTKFTVDDLFLVIERSVKQSVRSNEIIKSKFKLPLVDKTIISRLHPIHSFLFYDSLIEGLRKIFTKETSVIKNILLKDQWFRQKTNSMKSIEDGLRKLLDVYSDYNGSSDNIYEIFKEAVVVYEKY